MRTAHGAAAITLAGLVLASALASPVPSEARSDSPLAGPARGEGLACGYVLSPSVYAAWQALGGQDGRLGCATSAEAVGLTSPQGSASRAATFGMNGEIVLHVSGPHAGQAFAVAGCFYRLYVQYGGAGDWLGLPTGDSENTPDGARQAFEGGTMRYDRTPDTCEAEHADEAPPAAASPDVAMAPLDLYQNPATGERLSLASAASVRIAQDGGYQRLRAQARVLTEGEPGTARLKLFQNEAANLHELLATPLSEREALDRGLVFEAGQGFVWTAPRPGSVPLKLYRDPASGRTMLTAGEQDETDAVAAGLEFVRVEGYTPKAP